MLQGTSYNMLRHTSSPCQMHFGLRIPNCDLEVNFLNLRFVQPHISPHNGPFRLFCKDPVFEYSDGRRSAKTGSEWFKLDARYLVFKFSLNFAKHLVRQIHKHRYFSKRLILKVCPCHSLSISYCLVHPGMFWVTLSPGPFRLCGRSKVCLSLQWPARSLKRSMCCWSPKLKNDCTDSERW